MKLSLYRWYKPWKSYIAVATMQKQNMNWFAIVIRVVICFIILTDLTEFSVEFYVIEVFKFWVNSFDGLCNKEWKETKLGDAHGTPRYSRVAKSLSLGMPPEGIPSFVFVHW